MSRLDLQDGDICPDTGLASGNIISANNAEWNKRLEKNASYVYHLVKSDYSIFVTLKTIKC